LNAGTVVVRAIYCAQQAASYAPRRMASCCAANFRPSTGAIRSLHLNKPPGPAHTQRLGRNL